MRSDGFIRRAAGQDALASMRRAVLFTDFDGVLHPHPTAGRSSDLFCSMHLLEDVLRQVPEVEVVISSSWREHHPFDEMREYFAEDLRERIVGVTPMLRSELASISASLRAYPRHAECIAWLQQNRPRGTCWLAIDDTPEEFPPECTQLIVVDGADGLTAATAAVLLDRLRSLASG
jgi:hypothetical protein